MTKRRTPIDLFSLSCLFWKYYIKIVPKIVLPRISCIFKGTKIWGWPLSTLPMSHCSFMTHGLLSFNYHLTSLLNTLTQSCWCTQKGPTQWRYGYHFDQKNSKFFFSILPADFFSKIAYNIIICTLKIKWRFFGHNSKTSGCTLYCSK